MSGTTYACTHEPYSLRTYTALPLQVIRTITYRILRSTLFGIMSEDTNTDGREDIALPETHYRNPNLRTDGRYFINNSRSVTVVAWEPPGDASCSGNVAFNGARFSFRSLSSLSKGDFPMVTSIVSDQMLSIGGYVIGVFMKVRGTLSNYFVYTCGVYRLGNCHTLGNLK